MLQKALEYIKKGKPIFPVDRKTKKPLCDWGEYQKRLPSVEEVTDWWRRWPEANIGMATGKLSGVSVVDIDPRHEGVVPPNMPTMTTVVKTGGGGWHYYYQPIEGVKNTGGGENGSGYVGVDIRGEGGYVVIPPSIHENGNKYEVVVSEPLLPFPVDFFKIKHKKFDTASVVLGVNAGNRNMTATRLVGSLIGKYPKEEWELVVWPLLKAWNQTNVPPAPENEIRTTFDSIVKTHIVNHGKVYKETDYELKSLAEVAVDEKDDPRFSIGYQVLDSVLVDSELIGMNVQGGIALGEFMIIGGRPKHGKTLVAVHIAKSLVDLGFRCLWLSYEGKMKRLKKIMTRAQVKIKDVFVFELKNKVPLIGRIDWIEEKVKEAIDRFGTQLIVIDNLSFLQSSDKYSKQYDMLNDIVPRVHALAVQYDIVVILLAHVRKPPNQTGAPKRARMYDLSGTSTLEQLCDIGIMVERQYINENEFADKSFIHLDANRPSGEIKSLEVKYNGGILEEYSIIKEALDKLGGKLINEKML